MNLTQWQETERKTKTVLGQEYYQSMKRSQKLSVGLTAFLFVFASITPAYSASSVLNKSCTKLKATTVSAGKKLTCVSKSGKKVWALSSASKKIISTPVLVPNFSLKMTSNLLYATLIVPARDVINKEEIKNASVILYSKIDDNYIKVASRTVDSIDIVFGQYGGSTNFVWEIANKYYGTEMAVEIRYINETGPGEKALKSIPIPVAEPTPTPSPTPTPTPSPTPTQTPTPVTSAAPIAEVGCSVNYLSPLPYASQRMSITNMVWEKDSLGYVSVNMSIRNDNSMALRLVEFTFYLMHKGSIIITTSTLEGNHHFYIQDDTKFNSTDGIRGAWLPGQTRVFKIPTNQMLECKSISILSSGYTVKQGIGAS
jgi:hypothetical protein